MGKSMKPPAPIDIDDELFCMICRAEDGEAPYVDVQFDSVPPHEDDPDYSENPAALRKVAAWLVAAADWLEKEQGR
jgi:hypothetical protein